MEGRKNKILLVEDESIIAMVEKRQLEKYNYIVHHVQTGEKAVESALDEDSRYDLILMDIQLGPGIDGTQAAEQILAKHDIPIVFLSSHTEEEIVEKTEKISSYGYVVKNTGIVVLDASIKMALKLFKEKLERARVESELCKTSLLLDSIRKAQSTFIVRQDPEIVFPLLLDILVTITNSEFGFLDEVLYDPDGTPYKVNLAMSNIAWDNESKVLYERLRNRNLEFRNLKNLAGLPATLGEPILTNNASCDSRSGGLPAGHPAISSFLGLPISSGKTIIGVIGVANRQGGYDEEVIRFLEPYINTCATIIETFRLRNFEQKAVEILRTNESLLSRTQQIAHVGSWVLDFSTNQLTWSDEVYRIFGFKPQEFAPTYGAFLENVYPEDREAVNEAFLRSIKEEHSEYEMEHRIVCRTAGEVRYVYERCIHERDKAGHVLRSIGMVQDITEKKREEEFLRESEGKYRSLFNQSIYSIFLHNLKGQIIDVNEAACAQAGYTREELLQLTVFDLHPPGPTRTNLPKEEILRYWNEWMPNERHTYDAEHIRKDGTIMPVKISTGIVKIAGKPHILAAVVDITELKQAEEKIRKELSEKEILLKEIHHRIKNNIASIESFLSLQADLAQNEDVKSALNESILRIQSTRVLYENLLIGENYQYVSIKEYVDSLLDSLFTVFFDRKNISINKRIADFLISPKKAVDLGIIINELITNIYRHAFKGMDEGAIYIELEKSGSNATLIIEDNGIGIHKGGLEDKLPGFGLTIVKMMAEQLQADYSVESNKGTRSVLKFNL